MYVKYSMSTESYLLNYKHHFHSKLFNLHFLMKVLPQALFPCLFYPYLCLGPQTGFCPKKTGSVSDHHLHQIYRFFFCYVYQNNASTCESLDHPWGFWNFLPSEFGPCCFVSQPSQLLPINLKYCFVG